ncbi:MAG TPA: hypothetical protein VKD72_29865, partial [Gemmataceae bacterium]|nr:hypothetical protein [Gemmataceae bacterium]
WGPAVLREDIMVRQRGTVGTGVLLGLLALGMAGRADEAAAVKMVEKLGGSVMRDDKRPGHCPQRKRPRPARPASGHVASRIGNAAGRPGYNGRFADVPGHVRPADTKQICEGAFEYDNTGARRGARFLFHHDRQPPAIARGAVITISVAKSNVAGPNAEAKSSL